MAIPAFRAVGTQVNTANSVANPTSLTPTKNASTVNGDLMVLITASRNIAATVGTPTGWNIVSGFPKASATASGGKIYAYTRIADGTANDAPTVTWTGLTTGASGDSCSARILSYQNGTETADGTPPAANDAASTTSITIPAHVTSLAQSLVIGVAIRINDTAHTFTVATFTERQDGHTTSGTGHGTEVSEKINAAAGSSGTATVTPSNTTSSRTLAVSFGLAAAATKVTLNQVTETSTAQAVTRRKVAAAGQVTETDTTQAFAARKARAVAQATETDAAQSVTPARIYALAQATGADTAQSVTRGSNAQTVAVAQAMETSSATALTANKALAISQASEAGAAQAFVAAKYAPVGTAEETSAAQPFSQPGQQVVVLATATDSEAAQAFTAAKLLPLDLATETDDAQRMHAIVTPSNPGQQHRPVTLGFAAAMWRQKYEKQKLPKRKKNRLPEEEDEEPAPKLPKEWQPQADAAAEQARRTLAQAAAAAEAIESDRRRRAVERDEEELMLVL